MFGCQLYCYRVYDTNCERVNKHERVKNMGGSGEEREREEER
jgi:hypothetical protein